MLNSKDFWWLADTKFENPDLLVNCWGCEDLWPARELAHESGHCPDCRKEADLEMLRNSKRKGPHMAWRNQ